MLVTFHTKAWSSITLFGDVAVTLLKMAGHSGTVPGALLAADLPAAIAQLKKGLAAIPDEDGDKNEKRETKDDDAEPRVGLRSRAYPLIQLLSAASEQKCDVMWEQGAPRV